MINKKLDIAIAEYYYYILASIYLVSIYLPFIGTGILLGLFCLFLFWKNRKYIKPGKNIIFYFFYLYSLFSFVLYVLTDVPLSVYFKELPTQFLPMIFYWIGSNHIIEKNKFFKHFLFAVVLSFIVGFYYFIFPSTQYFNYIARMGNETYEGSAHLVSAGFHSIYGRILTGSFGVLALSLSIFNFWHNNKINQGISNTIYIISYILTLIATIMSGQRSAMVLAGLVLCSFFTFSIILRQKVSQFFIGINVIFVFFIISYLVVQYYEYFDYWLERLGSVDDAMSERDGQWKDYFKYTPSLLLGTGLGSAGFHAMEYSKYYITDGGIFKYVAEFGILGSSLFFISVIKAVFNGLKNLNLYYRELSIITICIIQSIGSNIICMPQTLPLFFYALGVLESSDNENL